MRIVIDMQGAQAVNRNRGIGRYTLSIVRAIAQHHGRHDIILALNGLFPDSIHPIRQAFQDLLPKENLRVWQAPGPCHHLDAANTWRRQAAELVREAFLASFNPTIMLVTSLFEGLGDDAVTSIGCLSQTVPTAAILYDLIPFINRDPYLSNPSVAEWYENKLGHLRRADLLLSISESTRQEGIQHLGFAPEQVVNVSTAADPHFAVREIDAATESNLRSRYGLGRDYVMYTGGIDHRKNIEGLIRAYSSLVADLRQQHQLAVVCAIQQPDRDRLTALARKSGMSRDELVLTGYVPEEDLIALYNLCKCFVFPSWHEGFGLPALEAMSCGRAVIGSNRSSLPEVIGRADALFDPFDDRSIAEKLIRVLTDNAFRNELEHHGLEQAKKFSWEKSAQLAIAALEAFDDRRTAATNRSCIPPRRPRLAYISPLPPERSGIADYSAELLPELSRHYDIEVIVAQEVVTTPWIRANYPIRPVDWFRTHAAEFDRVLYHFGNSAFHLHMFDLLELVPGIVVLHDFFLSGIVSHVEYRNVKPSYWSKILYEAHGYTALHQRFHAADATDVIWKYPCNLAVLQNAQGIIVHSDYSRRLARQWYGNPAGNDWICIPLLRVPVLENNQDRARARDILGLGHNDFVVCSFGMLGPTKLNHRLLDAWLSLPLAEDDRCILVFVGENDGGHYGAEMLRRIKRANHGRRIRITGWAEPSVFRQYLSAADVGVQLRTLSRGETSGAVLDCMNYGLATIINANGSMADLPDDGVVKIRDDFTDEELAEGLFKLWRDKEFRDAFGECAQNTIRTRHAPRTCADQYFDAIESFHCKATGSLSVLISSIARLEPNNSDAATWATLSECIDLSMQGPLSQRQLFVDISELVQRDVGTGIQRVVRSILKEWLLNPPQGYRVEPVYATTSQPGYFYARKFTLNFLDCLNLSMADDPITYYAGDVFLGLDFQPQVVPVQKQFYQTMRRQGVLVKFVVYDLLLIQMPHYFIEDGKKLFEDWLTIVAEADGAICISESVANNLIAWLRNHMLYRDHEFSVEWFHLGADFSHSASTKEMPEGTEVNIKKIMLNTTFLMVGTIEPRKCHAQVLAAFEKLWLKENINLVIVGKQGWMVEMLVEKIRSHPEMGKRLFWLERISDEHLEQIYAASTCLIAASKGEGFGLPLIEAAQHKLPIIARDIPVFREVAGEHAHYFDAQTPDVLAQAVKDWLNFYQTNQYPRSDNIPWLSWKHSAHDLFALLLH
jgi:glycosyltransferase involved in cell wall biosynthesis